MARPKGPPIETRPVSVGDADASPSVLRSLLRSALFDLRGWRDVLKASVTRADGKVPDAADARELDRLNAKIAKIEKALGESC